MTTLTIILHAENLSRELIYQIEECKKLYPDYLVINTTNNDVISYISMVYPRYHLTIIETTNLQLLTKTIATDYRTDYYLTLKFFAIDLIYLQFMYKELGSSNKRSCYLIRPYDNSNLVFEQVNQPPPIGKIDDRIFFLNNTIREQNYHYLMITNNDLPEPIYHPMKNRVVMITGILGGIGQAIAKEYYQNGWEVIGLDRLSNPLAFTTLSSTLSSSSYTTSSIAYCDQYYEIDLSKIKTLKSTILPILEKIRRLDALIHVAGYQICGPIVETDAENKTWDDIFNVNLRSIYLISKESFNKLKQSKGSMVVISSIHAFVSSKDISMYAISKAALSGLIRNFALEWGSHGIRVNGIAPGAIQTKMLMDGLGRRGDDPQIVLEELANRHLMKKVGTPEEISRLSFFLGDSTTCTFLTGQTIIADGGASILLSTEVS